MVRVRLTKQELKQQKDDLKRFTRFLPTLELKAKQLLLEINEAQQAIDALAREIEQMDAEVAQWADVFSEGVDLSAFFRVLEVKTDRENIASVDVPIFLDVVFEDTPYDLFQTPLWVDRGIEICKARIQRQAELQIVQAQQEILREEWRITNQRIKLFEEVRIPRARENIRKIQIFLGDEQTAAVVRGKIAKANLEKQKNGAGRI